MTLIQFNTKDNDTHHSLVQTTLTTAQLCRWIHNHTNIHTALWQPSAIHTRELSKYYSTSHLSLEVQDGFTCWTGKGASWYLHWTCPLVLQSISGILGCPKQLITVWIQSLFGSKCGGCKVVSRVVSVLGHFFRH
jgi:hypothetical protein